MRAIRILSVLALIGLICSSARAEELLSEAKIVDSPIGADIVFGPVAPARVYSTREAAKWGFDFLVSWSRAQDRVVLYGYKLTTLRPSVVEAVLREETDTSNGLAFINEVDFGPLPILGGDKGFYAAPVLSISSKFLSGKKASQFAELANVLVPRIVGIAALKSVGIRVADIGDIKMATSTKSFLCTRKPIPGVEVSKYFVIGDSAWSVPESSRSATWGLNF